MKISSFSGLAMLTAVMFAFDSNADNHIQKGDRLVFCGASNTGQHRYTQIVDTYLTCCRPDLEVTCSQAARSGESIDQFLGRMEETCIELFNPTVVTIDYNHNSTKRKDPSTKELEPVREMRDRFYRALHDAVSMFKGKGCRVVLCTASLLGDKWSNKEQNPRTEALIPVQKRVAEEMDCGIADFRGAMREAQEKIRSAKGDPGFDIVGGDGGHGGYHAHMVCAVQILRALGVSGDIADIRHDFKTGVTTVSEGHKLVDSSPGRITMKSERYPAWLPDSGSREMLAMRDVAEAMDFFSDLDCFMLQVTNLPPGSYRVRWGKDEKDFDAQALMSGINMAMEFRKTPFDGDLKNTADRSYYKLKLQWFAQAGYISDLNEHDIQFFTEINRDHVPLRPFLHTREYKDEVKKLIGEGKVSSVEGITTLFYLDTEVLTDKDRKAGITPQSIARDKDRTKRVLDLAQERVLQAHVGVEHSISITPR